VDDHFFNTDRDLLLEFIQWAVNHPEFSEDMFLDPLAADLAVEEFLQNLWGKYA
jgi:hypothetical protein